MRNALGAASGNDLDLRAKGLRREAAVPPDPERPLRAVEGHNSAQELHPILLDVRRLARPRADDLAAAEHQEDDLRLVDAVDESRELLRLIFDRTRPEGDCDRVEVERGAEVRRGDDVLDLDLRILLDRDAGG